MYAFHSFDSCPSDNSDNVRLHRLTGGSLENVFISRDCFKAIMRTFGIPTMFAELLSNQDPVSSYFTSEDDKKICNMQSMLIRRLRGLTLE